MMMTMITVMMIEGLSCPNVALPSRPSPSLPPPSLTEASPPLSLRPPLSALSLRPPLLSPAEGEIPDMVARDWLPVLENEISQVRCIVGRS